MEKQETNYNMVDWWKKAVLKNYANFSGRARRSEYWYFVLFNLLLIVPFYIVAIVGLTSDNSALSVLGMIVYCIVGLGTLIPGLAVAVRRLHDLNKSGWYYFVALIPFVGGIILLVWFCTEGTQGSNNYGSDPKNLKGPEFDFEQTS
jgi:uncharacterized membrane protein YhaH (DUF805 family)